MIEQLNTLLNYSSNVLFIAPTGWGKTTFLLDLVKKSTKTCIYLAPLRALANEFYLRTAHKKYQSLLISHMFEVHQLVDSSIEAKLIVITPELVTQKFLNKYIENSYFVFDEIHLFYYWGDGFRPRLRELYLEVVSQQAPCLMLSATMGEDLLKRWQQEAKLNYEHAYCINLNNHCLRKDPELVAYIPRDYHKFYWDYLLGLKSKHTKLVFCAYRKQVLDLVNQLKELDKKVVYCLGGEVVKFQEQLSLCPEPEFIIATSVISHGVNLPKISLVYLTRKINNYDFWIQMAGRAGRQGESFVVWSRDKYRINTGSWVKSILLLIKVALLSKIFPYALRRYFNS